MTCILITGASGFIGRHILAQALASRKGEVHGVGRTRPDGLSEAVAWHEVDLRDSGAAAALVRRLQPTHLIHGAWIATPGVYAHSPENLEWMRAGVALANAFGEGGGQRFVGLGSSAEYGAFDGAVAEDRGPLDPASVYGKCKLGCWWGIQAAAQHHGFSAAWGRIFLPYGPGDPSQRLVPALMRALSSGQPIPTTEGHQQRDFVRSTDVADMLFRLLWVEQSGAFNIGSGIATPVRSAMELVADHFDARHLLQFGARAMQPGETMVLVADMTKTEQALGGIAPMTLSDGVADAVKDFRAGNG